jgi:hypothetical protein
MATTSSILNREAFIKALKDGGVKSPVSRNTLLEFCDSTGIYKVPPSWITYDHSRKTGKNGYYLIPELDDAPVASAEEKESQQALALALTSGDRVTLVPEKIDTYVSFGSYDDLAKIVKSRLFYPVFITGLSGNGKTTMVDQICANLDRELFRVNILSTTDEDDLLGGFRLVNGETVWRDGPVTEAMQRGGVLLLDEVDLGSTKIMCLQPVLEGKGVYIKKANKFVKPAEGFTIFATANTKGKGSDDGRFVGTNVMNEAFLDRFAICIEQEYAPQKVEEKILKKTLTKLGLDGDLDVEFAKTLTKWAELIRQTYYEGGVDEIVTTRRLLDILKAYAVFGSNVDTRLKAIEMTTTRFDDDTKEAFITMYKKIDGSLNLPTGLNPADSDSIRLESKDTYDVRETIKGDGGKFDGSYWYITAAAYNDNREFYDGLNPRIAADNPFA